MLIPPQNIFESNSFLSSDDALRVERQYHSFLVHSNSMWAAQLSSFLMTPQRRQKKNISSMLKMAILFSRVIWACSGDHHREHEPAKLSPHPVECSWTISHHQVHLALETGECHMHHHLFTKILCFLAFCGVCKKWLTLFQQTFAANSVSLFCWGQQLLWGSKTSAV